MTSVCKVDGCDRPARTRGWCRAHYRSWLKWGDPLRSHPRSVRDGVCSIEGCDRPHYGRGWCGLHWKRWRRHGDAVHIAKSTPGPRTPKATPDWLDLDQLAAVNDRDDSWRDRQACGNEPAGTFFPTITRGERYDYSTARSVCGRCTVRLECLAWWLSTWPDKPTERGCYIGDTTPAERDLIRQALTERRARRTS